MQQGLEVQVSNMLAAIGVNATKVAQYDSVHNVGNEDGTPAYRVRQELVVVDLPNLETAQMVAKQFATIVNDVSIELDGTQIHVMDLIDIED